MTISGAAASPNMGYHTSPLVRFVMMLFNARLGAWLGNPGEAGEGTWRESGPRSAVSSVVKEALALTNDCSAYVYLSDGGHFENLALYEMARRRCRIVVVVDGGCDRELTYEDLGNAMRKIRVDIYASRLSSTREAWRHCGIRNSGMRWGGSGTRRLMGM